MNRTGINPIEHKVLLQPKAVEEKTVGGIFIPDTTKDTEKYRQTEGVIIAVSPLAFSYASPEEWEAVNSVPPKVGQTVLYARHAGATVKGKDGEDYLLVNDQDIVATIEANND